MYLPTAYIPKHHRRPTEFVNPDTVKRLVGKGTFYDVSLSTMTALADELEERSGSPKTNAEAKVNMLNWLYDELHNFYADGVCEVRWEMVNIVYTCYPTETRAEIEAVIASRSHAFMEAIGYIDLVNVGQEDPVGWQDKIESFCNRYQNLPDWARYAVAWVCEL